MTGSRNSFLDVADRIGCRLCRDAIWAEGQCNWLGWSMEFRRNQWAPAYRAMSGLMYDGTAGIGLFLARLSALTGEPIARATARGALRQALSASDRLAEGGEYGWYAGLGGIAQCCIEAAPLLDDAELGERGRATLLRTARMPPDPKRLDVINGSAGVIRVLLAATGPPDDTLEHAATAHGEQLLARAERGPHGWSWNTLGAEGQINLLGYSHGTAGIACALAELGRRTGRKDFVNAAREALRYERFHFRPRQGNWPDFREFNPANSATPAAEPPCMLAWCHGAPGIGMGRLRMASWLPENDTILADAEIAIATTVASLQPGALHDTGNFSLCHGHAGNADLLVLAADQLGRPSLRHRAEQAALAAAARYEQQSMPWPCGVPGAGETPNLMLGLAGIGYFFLRLHDSRAVPSVL